MNKVVLARIKRILEEDKVAWLNRDEGIEEKAERILSVFVSVLQSRLDEIETPECWHPEEAGIESCIMYLRGLDWSPATLMEELNEFEVEKKSS
jgi:hypothetical protein